MLTERLAEANEIINQAIGDFPRSPVFVLFSGGHDSLTVAHVAMRHEQVKAVVHINTGIGIEETRSFVRRTCSRHEWPLIERSPPKLSYDDMVLRYGFPGPGGHRYPYVWLKEKTLRAVVNEHRPRGVPAILITGVRKQESKQRMGRVEPIARDPRRSGVSAVWAAPLFNWTASDCAAYIADCDLERNQVVDLLHMSGECLCGAYARKNEIEELALWYPDVVERIHDLERRAFRSGVHCQWGIRPPRRYTEIRRGQLELMPLCMSCQGDPDDDDQESIA